MVNVRPAFLALPERAEKPRRRGITHVLDKGMPAGEVDALLQVCGPYVDVWKLGWGTAYLDPGIGDKLALLDHHGVLACTGGTLLEVAWQQGAVDEFLDWAASAGFPCVEVSCGVVNMTATQKRALIETTAARFIVLGEIGAKDPGVPVSAREWALAAAADLEAGATWVVTEGRGRAAPSGCTTPPVRCAPTSWKPWSMRSESTAPFSKPRARISRPGSSDASAPT